MNESERTQRMRENRHLEPEEIDADDAILAERILLLLNFMELPDE